ncbi:hypothetical protein M407DRAFT_102435 [Tulasnella calospora MUT 4182]|uniref:PIN domain-containing protein n=1 Tax=Tulasnella calospora MUT 4182 TaxID=1051891 RepID=A0A0C3QG41_9AGAM|nr:hypothetical protein M407DRAFT_102435 [Tulasnella calospora MUT 4182]
MDNKEKMSRALGTAYLSHQVSQLEKDIIKGSNNGHQGRGSARGGGRGGRGGARGGSRGGGRNGHPRPQLGTLAQADDNQDSNRPGATQWRSNTAVKDVTQAKAADRIVVDASVLIHALGTVRTWCRDSSKEVVIIPLEALNTLDLLKKGTSHTAVQARHASRLLEAQVGTNPRILVQQDHGYIPWEEVFTKVAGNRLSTESASTASSSEGTGARSSSEISRTTPAAISLAAARRVGEPPEWLKRTVCCAKFEQQRPRDSLDGEDSGNQLKTVLAISCVQTGPRETQDNRFSDRATGTYTRQWAVKAGLEILDVEAGQDAENGARKTQRGSRFNRIDDSDNEVSIKDGVEEAIPPPAMVPWGGDLAVADSTPPKSVRGGYQSGIHHRKPSGEGTFHPKSRGTEPPSPRRPVYDNARGGYRGRRPSGSLVEKPSAPIPLTNAGFLPAGKTIRLLARGEKLEP